MDPEDIFTSLNWITPLKALIEQDLLQKVSDVATDSYSTIEYLQSFGINCTNIQKFYSIKMHQWVWMCSVPREDEEYVRRLLKRLQ